MNINQQRNQFKDLVKHFFPQNTYDKIITTLDNWNDSDFSRFIEEASNHYAESNAFNSFLKEIDQSNPSDSIKITHKGVKELRGIWNESAIENISTLGISVPADILLVVYESC